MSEHPSAPDDDGAGKKSGGKNKDKSKGKKAKLKLDAAVAEAMQTPAAEQTSPAPAEPGRTFAPPPAAAAGLASAADLSAKLLDPNQREVLEKLSMNLARAALTAQGAIAEQALRQADRPAALSPDPFNVAPALTDVMGRLAAQPDRLVRAQSDLFARYLELWQSASRRAAGGDSDPVVQAGKGDKRFADPEWTENAVFDIIKHSYLLTSNWLNSLVAEVDGADPMNKRRVEFFMK
ncbi:MAG: class I poly(R)-hydroxyalkanoic acid synthase, partial [Phenylobacterium sp.]|nr:class I poly(R)-hydroxyalkanoic acid synthase [Phenylobacterium sp.]